MQFSRNIYLLDPYIDNLLVYGEMVLKSRSFMIITTGTLSVDTFFFMSTPESQSDRVGIFSSSFSGLLTTYLTLNRYRVKFGSKPLAKFWSLFVLHRIIR
ncbi:hypothetical protein FBUS_04080 [Fasciolopsis buskii]|uniref:Uncharacterized protein n=1 Tax=Fasciolopsis buskii TaxID=27845 RepID=A0A8E0S0C2_9TREM|nr:hypothetical protein FBUS_04080 [Fasciolopsis buski]